ncbi:hexamerin-like [Copidosoma floridanum]|uniref:hexamerin-like n=1 Tax=Copidosoma floridanum TaxID=29053 RepID=UPI0006C9BB95|nr:hexamerin-like [Copidosoma floridanum]
MRFSIVFLALFALAAAVPTVPKLHAADQDFLAKQQDVIHLLENIAGQLPNDHLRNIGSTYEFEPYLKNYENPSVVKYYLGLYATGHVQPQHTPYSYSVSQLRKEVALLTQIFLGAKDYVTFLSATAWARVHVNQDQFVTAFAQAVLQRHDLQGVILPAPYEVYPHYFFDARIIQKVQDHVNNHIADYQTQGDKHEVHTIHVNYTSYLPYDENKIAYFTEDIGLSAYYSYVQLSGYMMPYGEHGWTDETTPHHIGHGSHYYYVHQQLLAHYNLERLGQGLGPIHPLDDYYEHIETPYKPNLRYLNGINFPGRDEHIYVTNKHHSYELIKLVRILERRILDAIDAGQVITPQGAFLSLYQPQGLNILGELIEGTGRSINPRYYGSYMYVARQLLGQSPYFSSIYEYSPSALELGQTAVRDPIFYQLYNKIIEMFHYYQESLPAYQYSDLIVPGVSIEKVDVSELITYFSDYEVDLANAIAQPVGGSHEHQPFPKVVAHLKRLDHKPYEFSIHVNSEKVLPGAVFRVYVGPKYNYDGQPIDITTHRHYFYELDQFVYDLTEGKNIIVRNSHEATGQSYDWPTVSQLKERVQGAFRSQNPYYIHYPEQLYSFPARLSLPKGSPSGFPLQFFVIVSAAGQPLNLHYGPVVAEQWRTYQPHHYQVVGTKEYEQFTRNPVDKIHGGYQHVEVIPDFDAQIITHGNFHYGYLYKKYPGSYYYPRWQQTHYEYGSHPSLKEHHGVEQHVGDYSHQYASPYTGSLPQSGTYKYPYAYQKVVENGPQGSYQQSIYKQGMYESKSQDVYHGSGYYSGSQYSTVASTYPVNKGREEYIHNYYQNKYIGDVIGGGISLDNKPLGYPFDRPLANSAMYVPNIYIADAIVYHEDEKITEY